LPTTPGNFKYAAVVIEYFSKWIEAKALRDITAATLQKFFWQNIVCRFGVPKEITIDNGKQFDYTTFREFCQNLGTKLCFASVYHPQSNGAVERANGIIFSGIKKNITEQPKGKWVDELPKLIWSHNIIESRATKFTPFKLLYGEEAMTPEELRQGSYRTEPSDEDIKPTIETIKTQAAINLGRYQEETRRWRNKKVRPREINEGDLVLQHIPKSKQQGKMHSKWEGSFLVASMARPEACRLRTLEGVKEPYS
jgi:transposase InsO family protein